MNGAKVTITLNDQLLRKVDGLVKSRVFPNRSQAVRQALEEKIARMDKSRLARECARLDRREEQAWADEGLDSEASAWPTY